MPGCDSIVSLCYKLATDKPSRAYAHFDIYSLQKISVSRTSRSAQRDLALLQMLVLLGKHLPEDDAHRDAERISRNANHVGAGIRRTP